MSSSAPLHDPVQAAFDKAIWEFKAGLKNEALYREILSTTSADQVYDLTDKLQAEKPGTGGIRNLAKLQPYLERLQSYNGAIDTFVQAKPDVLALIWGPIKLLVQWASTLVTSLDALINTTAEIGLLLPEFSLATKLFERNDMIRELLALFFQDILDFYLVSLKFFSMPRFKAFFEALWPKKKQQIDSVINRIARHATMLRNEVRLEHIQEEHHARAREMEHFENLERSTRRTEYRVLETSMAPTFYDKKLNYLRGRLCGGTGSWLLNDSHMRKWLNATEDSPNIIWLRGIPGAGKTFLAACVVDDIRSSSSSCNQAIFSFLSHAFQHSTLALSVVHSLIFQLARDDSALQDVVCEVSRETLSSDLAAATDVLIKILACSGPVHIVIDGLDEIDETERVLLLQEMLRVSESCKETRILIGSRSEHDLATLLKPVSTEIRVDTQNTDSIQNYVTSRYCDWAKSRGFGLEEEREIMELLAPIAGRAKGMFMYAQLILRSLEFLDTIDEVRDELKVLPTDLKDAYGRIFLRINKRLPDFARDKARRILGWVGCSPVPMTIRELEQALSIRPGDYRQIPKGYSALNLVLLCGPVVEVVDGEVQFVHFTAKEQLENVRSVDTATYLSCLLPPITAGNLETSKWLAIKAQQHVNKMHRYDVKHFRPIFVEVLMSDRSVALYNHIEALAVFVYSRTKRLFGASTSTSSIEAMDPQIVSATRGRPQSERILITLWRKLNDMGFVPRKYFGTGLRSVAATTCSITLASELIDLGADLDYQSNRNQARPLQRAAQQDTEEAAKFMRFLLYRGAKPEIEYEKQQSTELGKNMGREYVSTRVTISEEVGTKGISKWLTKFWEDLVAEATEARMNSDNPPIPEN
ncbi:hypothetical protein DL764_006102 [Monosporascus ibericus]|uniref:NACHT domain-containing protein n=1 Tax=Monosporascus ibericus TaxID=155417 RepID=A0A4Q4T8V1_9PEZI|nr:hypothetical protein DL764_006102 [Monosporascus ibericus]